MGVDVDAVLFWGITDMQVDLDSDPDWEPKLADAGCEVIFCVDHLHLGVSESLVRHSMWGASSRESLAVAPAWPEQLAAGLRALGLPDTKGRWFLACSVY